MGLFGGGERLKQEIKDLQQSVAGYGEEAERFRAKGDTSVAVAVDDQKNREQNRLKKLQRRQHRRSRFPWFI